MLLVRFRLLHFSLVSVTSIFILYVGIYIYIHSFKDKEKETTHVYQI